MLRARTVIFIFVLLTVLTVLFIYVQLKLLTTLFIIALLTVLTITSVLLTTLTALFTSVWPTVLTATILFTVLTVTILLTLLVLSAAVPAAGYGPFGPGNFCISLDEMSMSHLTLLSTYTSRQTNACLKDFTASIQVFENSCLLRKRRMRGHGH